MLRTPNPHTYLWLKFSFVFMCEYSSEILLHAKQNPKGLETIFYCFGPHNPNSKIRYKKGKKSNTFIFLSMQLSKRHGKKIFLLNSINDRIWKQKLKFFPKEKLIKILPHVSIHKIVGHNDI